MARNLFSVPIFFIVFRETLEAAIIVSVLLGLVEQIIHEDSGTFSSVTSQVLSNSTSDEKSSSPAAENVAGALETDVDDSLIRKRRLIRKLRIQVRLSDVSRLTWHALNYHVRFSLALVWASS
jgi:high-affinity iron transporter